MKVITYTLLQILYLLLQVTVFGVCTITLDPSMTTMSSSPTSTTQSITTAPDGTTIATTSSSSTTTTKSTTTMSNPTTITTSYSTTNTTIVTTAIPTGQTMVSNGSEMSNGTTSNTTQGSTTTTMSNGSTTTTPTVRTNAPVPDPTSNTNSTIDKNDADPIITVDDMSSNVPSTVKSTTISLSSTNPDITKAKTSISGLPKPTKESERSSYGSLIGVAVVCVLILVAIGILVIFLLLRKRSKKQEDHETPITREKGEVLLNKDIGPYISRQQTENQGFQREFNALGSGQQNHWSIGSSPDVTSKNRYHNIIPYNHNRVILQKLSHKGDSDYINASLIDGYDTNNKYIATQGPQAPCIDFWQMIWEQNVSTVVMLTNLVENGMEKSSQYWPDDGQSMTYGTIMVRNVDEAISPDRCFTVRKLAVKEGKSDVLNNTPINSREVLQFHFTEWPDKDVPEHTTSLNNLVRSIRKHYKEDNSPIIVHCCAGVGRTGTFIALDCLIDQGELEGKVDVFGCVNRLREQRVSMVETEKQYTYLYYCVHEAVNVGETSVKGINLKDFLTDSTKNKQIAAQYKFLKGYGQSLVESRKTQAAELPENTQKNYDTKNLPGDDVRVILTNVDGRNDYINAVFTPTSKRKRGTILTQQPLQGTVVDFWRMVYDHDVTSIVMLNNYQNQKENTFLHWPAEEADKLNVEPFTISRWELKKQDNIITCHLVVNNGQTEKKVFLVGALDWKDDAWQPKNLNSLYNLHRAVKKQASESPKQGKMIIQCLNGNMNSGMYAAVSWIFDTINAEQEVDIYTIAKTIIHSKPEFLTKEEQYKALYDIAADYIKYLQTHSGTQRSGNSQTNLGDQV